MGHDVEDGKARDRDKLGIPGSLIHTATHVGERQAHIEWPGQYESVEKCVSVFNISVEGQSNLCSGDR
jgi:hypothetical protein